MAVIVHRRLATPAAVDRVVALHGIERFEALPAADHVQPVVYDGHAELEAPAGHKPALLPAVGAQVVRLDDGGACGGDGRNSPVRGAAGG